MIWGIEGHHAWTPPGEDRAAIELGRLFDDRGDAVWPHFKLRRVGGLMSLGDPEDNRDIPVGRIGELTRLANRRGKTVTYEGDIIARTLIELRTGEATLRAAFAEQSTEGRMDVSPHVLNTAFRDVPPKFFTARALIAEVIDEQGSSRWSRPFVVGLRMGDPRYFDEETESYSLTIAATDTTYAFSDA